MVHDNHGLKRSLQPRHIRLMALGSTIGVGLFLGSATAIQLAGPSIMLGYVLAGLVAFIVLRALGEMAVHEPVAGSFAHYAGKYIGPLAGYLVGWGYWTYWIVVGLAEVTAVGIYMMMWFPDVPQWVWALSSLLAMGGIPRGRPRPRWYPTPRSGPCSSSSSCASTGALGRALPFVTWSSVDRCEVVVLVAAAFGEGGDVVDLVGSWHVADVADGAVGSEDAAVPLLLG